MYSKLNKSVYNILYDKYIIHTLINIFYGRESWKYAKKCRNCVTGLMKTILIGKMRQKILLRIKNIVSGCAEHGSESMEKEYLL